MDTRYTIRITDNFGAYAEAYRFGTLAAHSEQISWTVEMRSETLEDDLRQEFGENAIITDLRA